MRALLIVAAVASIHMAAFANPTPMDSEESSTEGSADISREWSYSSSSSSKNGPFISGYGQGAQSGFNTLPAVYPTSGQAQGGYQGNPEPRSYSSSYMSSSYQPSVQYSSSSSNQGSWESAGGYNGVPEPRSYSSSYMASSNQPSSSIQYAGSSGQGNWETTSGAQEGSWMTLPPQPQPQQSAMQYSGNWQTGNNWNTGNNWANSWNNNVQGSSWTQGPPSWRASYTPMPGQSGCFNRCRPSCSSSLPPPQPQYPGIVPSRPSFGCQPSCRSSCSVKPSCGRRGNSQWAGNTLVCGRPSRPFYNNGGGYYPGYGQMGYSQMPMLRQNQVTQYAPQQTFPSQMMSDQKNKDKDDE